MANSTCIKCGHTQFELVMCTPHRSRFKYQLLQCASCGGVVGALDYFNIGAVLEQIKQKLGITD